MTLDVRASQPLGYGEILCYEKLVWSRDRAHMWRRGNPASAEHKMSNHFEAVHQASRPAWSVGGLSSP